MIKDISPIATRIRFWSIVAITAAAYLQTVIMCSEPWMTPGNLFVLGLSVVYSLGCVFAQPWCERKASIRWSVGYFAVQIPLATLLLFLIPHKGPGVYFLLPLISQAMFVFPLRVAAWLSIALFGVAVAHLAILLGWDAALRYTPAYAAGFIFTAGISYLLVREAASRKQATVLNQRLEEANARLREAAAQTGELAVTRERNRLAREIHDGLGHYLTTIAVQAEAARALLSKDPARADASMAKTRTLAEEALADVRRSVGVLRTEMARASLVQQLQTLSAAAGFLVDIDMRGEPRPLPLAVEHALYRTAQEGLTNVRKHAHATRATITIDFRPADRVCVDVVDDGHESNGRGAGGFGLNGVRERVEALGGKMEAGFRPQGGFALHVEVPG